MTAGAEAARAVSWGNEAVGARASQEEQGKTVHTCAPRRTVMPDARDHEGEVEITRDAGHDRERVSPNGTDLAQWLGLRGVEQFPKPRAPRWYEDSSSRTEKYSQGTYLIKPSIEAGILSVNGGRDQLPLGVP